MTDKTIAQAVEAELAVSMNPLQSQVADLLRGGTDPDALGHALIGAANAIAKALADEEPSVPPRVLPGDVVQIVGQEHPLRGWLGVVEQTRSWGVELMTEAGQQRAKLVDLHVVGVAVLLSPEILKARRDALEALA